MSLLVVGLSHRTAPVSLLERAALGEDARRALLTDTVAAEPAAEAVALATCNRIELYADVDRFHAGVAELSALLARHGGVGLEELTPHLYVHYEDRAVHHLFSVACGLDSMVVGEGQILAQIKDALAVGQHLHTAGRLLNDLFQQALRVGKRAHSETGIDRAGQSLVTFGLDQVATALGGPGTGFAEWAPGRRALVIGAGSMSSLAATTLARAGVAELVIANRTHERAERLAAATGGRAAPMSTLAAELPHADLVVSCTGAAGLVLHADQVARALLARTTCSPGEPVGLLDLAMPRDVDPLVRALDGAHLTDIESIAAAAADAPLAADVDLVRGIVSAEVEAFGAAQRAAHITPTVVALRSMAAEVVQAELARLDGRLPGLAERERAEVAQTVRRVVDKLLHAPTVRVKQLAGEPGGASYADALRELFDLDPQAVAAVSRANAAPAAPAAPVGAGLSAPLTATTVGLPSGGYAAPAPLPAPATPPPATPRPSQPGAAASLTGEHVVPAPLAGPATPASGTPRPAPPTAATPAARPGAAAPASTGARPAFAAQADATGTGNGVSAPAGAADPGAGACPVGAHAAPAQAGAGGTAPAAQATYPDPAQGAGAAASGEGTHTTPAEQAAYGTPGATGTGRLAPAGRATPGGRGAAAVTTHEVNRGRA
jgi:glutamyl-tRNA reductase